MWKSHLWILYLGWTFPLRTTFLFTDTYRFWALTLRTKLFKLPQFVRLIHQSHCFTKFSGFDMLVKFMFYMRIIWKTYGSISTPVPPSWTFHLFMCFPFYTTGWFAIFTARVISTRLITQNNTSLWLSSPYSKTLPRTLREQADNKRKKWIHTLFYSMQASNNVFSLEKVITEVSQCKGAKLAASGEVGETGMSKAVLGICKAARLLFFEQALVWREGEASPWELAAWRAPQPMESSGEGSEFTAGLLSGQVWAVWGFPWGHEVDRSGGRVADSSRPLVPCVHWGGTRKGRAEKKIQVLMRRASEINRANSRVLNHFSECSNSCARWIKDKLGVKAGHTSDLKQQFPNVSSHRFVYGCTLDLRDHIW